MPRLAWCAIDNEPKPEPLIKENARREINRAERY